MAIPHFDAAQILEGLPDPLLLLDAGRNVVWQNDAAQTLLGRDATGQRLSAVFRQPALLSAAEALSEKNPESSVDFLIPGKIERNLSARLRWLAPEERGAGGVLLCLQDLTEARRSEQMRRDFVANVSHELRTPLTSLIGFIETLRGPARDDPAARDQFLEIMAEQSDRMTRLLEDLLSLARIELEEHRAPRDTVDIAEALQSVATALAPQAEEAGVEIQVEADDLSPVAGERDELFQVFQNLADNAIKYGDRQNPVLIRAAMLPPGGGTRRLGGPGLKVQVINRGTPIAREHLPRLTERFYRVDAARSRQLGGTGLGLAIVKHIVNRHKGVLEIDSDDAGTTTFSVYLPTV